MKSKSPLFNGFVDIDEDRKFMQHKRQEEMPIIHDRPPFSNSSEHDRKHYPRVKANELK